MEQRHLTWHLKVRRQRGQAGRAAALAGCSCGLSGCPPGGAPPSPAGPKATSTACTRCPVPPEPQDSDERACAYIAGPAPNRWGNFTAAQQEGRRAEDVSGAAVQPPLQLSASPTAEEIQRAAAVRRAHPLYASVTLGALRMSHVHAVLCCRKHAAPQGDWHGPSPTRTYSLPCLPFFVCLRRSTLFLPTKRRLACPQPLLILPPAFKYRTQAC